MDKKMEDKTDPQTFGQELKGKANELAATYFGKGRLALATIVFFSSLTIIEVVIWHLDFHLPISAALFHVPLTIGALVGYYLAREASSRAWLVVLALVVIFSFPAYYYCLMTFVGITFVKIAALVLLLTVGVGALYATLRILINQGL